MLDSNIQDQEVTNIVQLFTQLIDEYTDRNPLRTDTNSFIDFISEKMKEKIELFFVNTDLNIDDKVLLTDSLTEHLMSKLGTAECTARLIAIQILQASGFLMTDKDLRRRSKGEKNQSTSRDG